LAALTRFCLSIIIKKPSALAETAKTEGSQLSTTNGMYQKLYLGLHILMAGHPRRTYAVYSPCGNIIIILAVVAGRSAAGVEVIKRLYLNYLSW